MLVSNAITLPWCAGAGAYAGEDQQRSISSCADLPKDHSRMYLTAGASLPAAVAA